MAGRSFVPDKRNRMCVAENLERLRSNQTDEREHQRHQRRDERDEGRNDGKDRRYIQKNNKRRSRERSRERSQDKRRESRDKSDRKRGRKFEFNSTPVFIELNAFCAHYMTPNGKGGYNPPKPEAIQKLIIQFESRKHTRVFNFQKI